LAVQVSFVLWPSGGARVRWHAVAVSVVPQHYAADDRRLLQAKALTFGAVNEVDLEDDGHGFALLPAAGPDFSVCVSACCVHVSLRCTQHQGAWSCGWTKGAAEEVVGEVAGGGVELCCHFVAAHPAPLGRG